jgi:hypothetical protein
MYLHVNFDLHDLSFCDLSYSEQEGCLQAIWRGYIDPMEGQPVSAQ